MLAKRVEKIKPSPTLAITAKAAEMKKKGIPVISFGAGEPDFPTPLNIKQAAISSIQENFTKYTPTSGILELKEAICKKFKEDNNLDYTPSQILVSCGAKHSLYNIIQALVDKGDEVIIPSPYWVSYLEMVHLACGKPVLLKTDKNFQIPIDKLKKKIQKKTKILILNSPNNPTGAVSEKEILEEIAKIALDNNFYIISDEIYEKIIYDDKKHYSIASFSEEVKNKTIVVNGVSKTYSMTGWRIGYAAGEEKIMKICSQIQDHSTSNPTSIAQKAALEAIKGEQNEVKKMVEEFDRRRKYIVEKLNNIKGISCNNPAGAFYVFPKVKKFFNSQIKNSTEITEYLLEEAKVAVVPGIVFGSDEHIRLSYATSLNNIIEGLNKMEEALKKLI